MSCRTYLTGLLLGLACLSSNAQDPPELPEPLSLENNRLIGRAELLPFLQKLHALEAGLLRRVSIVHIGDSHIQADWLTGYLRRELQARFGNAGRGLVFPYRTAGTHGPVEVPDESSGRWLTRRKTFEHPEIELGISGMTIRSRSSVCSLQMACAEWPFDRVTVFHTGTAQLDDAGSQYSSFRHGTHWEFPEPVSSLELELRPAGADLYGLLLHNSREPGLLYHALGVNGATFTHFNRAPLLLEQLPWLQPDLLIVSLGTNEALQSVFDREQVEQQAREWVRRLQRAAPGVPILLTTPPDALLDQQRDNPKAAEMRELIVQLAREEQLACWDLHQIMGGRGSVRSWRELELAHTDFIHFTKPGYELQGRLLLEALLDAYGKAP